MTICIACGHVFDERDTTAWWSPDGEYYSCCPRCGSDELDEAVLCEECGEYTDAHADGLCDSCFSKRKEARPNALPGMSILRCAS